MAQLFSQSFFRFHDSFCVRGERACVYAIFLVFSCGIHIPKRLCTTENTIFFHHSFFFLFSNSFCKFHIFFEFFKWKRGQKKGRKWNCNWNAPLITLSLSNTKKSMKITHTRLCFKRKFHPLNMVNALLKCCHHDMVSTLYYFRLEDLEFCN